MKIARWAIGSGLATLLVVGAAFGQAAAPPAKDGKTLFTENHCNSCHTIASQGIEKKKVEGEESTGDKKPPDLSDVGAKVKADWMTKFLTKKEKLEGDLHPKRFKGSEADLATLTTWLQTLQKKAPAKK